MKKTDNMSMEEMLEKAQRVDFEDLLANLGYHLEGDGAQKRIQGTGQIVVDTEQNAYMDFGSGKGGSPVDFLIQHQHMEKEDAAQAICKRMEAGTLKTYHNPKAFQAPEKHETNKHVYAYLTKEKGIDGEIVNNAIKRGVLYETMQERITQDGEVKPQYRCVFAGMDSDRNIKSAHMQAAYEVKGQAPFQYQAKNSSTEHGFNTLGRNENLFVFRDPVDALREATLEKMNGMDWRSNHRLALPVLDTAPIENYLKNVRGIDNVYLCLPDDKTSQYHAARIEKELQEKHIHVMNMPMAMSLEAQLTARRAEEYAPASTNMQEPDMDVLEENEVEDRVFVLAYDPNAEKPYFVYEAVGDEKADVESFPTREAATEAMEERIDELEESEEMSR